MNWLAQGRNVWVARETTSLREECASELAAVLDSWTCPIDTDVPRNLSVRALNARMKYSPPNSRRSEEFGVGVLEVPD